MFRISTFLILFLAIISLADAKIYRWVDDQGNVHFGDKPQADNAELLKLPTTPSPSTPPPSAADRKQTQQKMLDIHQEDREKKKAAKIEDKKKAKELRKQCADARDRLARYLRTSRMYENTGEGERRWFTEAERNTEIEHLRKKIKHACK
ncbi:hypothetical protein MNBD_GAMMA26-543 [hydrothermal vent metagenome]|uniref:DUF4124 domain-containing protein n=1 Tax=hydrothermal vent metagenome TaxID=652676 RepID=A0A3B1BUJ8_9ZZZZ